MSVRENTTCPGHTILAPRSLASSEVSEEVSQSFEINFFFFKFYCKCETIMFRHKGKYSVISNSLIFQVLTNMMLCVCTTINSKLIGSFLVSTFNKKNNFSLSEGPVKDLRLVVALKHLKLIKKSPPRTFQFSKMIINKKSGLYLMQLNAKDQGKKVLTLLKYIDRI